jgi:hypothetical protein
LLASHTAWLGTTSGMMNLRNSMRCMDLEPNKVGGSREKMKNPLSASRKLI